MILNERLSALSFYTVYWLKLKRSIVQTITLFRLLLFRNEIKMMFQIVDETENKTISFSIFTHKMSPYVLYFISFGMLLNFENVPVWGKINWSVLSPSRTRKMRGLCAMIRLTQKPKIKKCCALTAVLVLCTNYHHCFMNRSIIATIPACN